MQRIAIVSNIIGLLLCAATVHAQSPAGATTTATDKWEVRGVVRAVRQAEIRSDLTARVKKIPFREGESFSKGDLLIEFDCRALRAEVKAVDAAYRVAKAQYENAVEMNRLNAAGLYEVQIRKAEMSEALFRTQAGKARVDNCVIKAPYSGRIAERHVNPFETPNAGEPLLKIVGGKELEIRLIAPSQWLSWLKIGANLEFVIDETGGGYAAVVGNIGAEVDAVSGTVPIIATFNDPEKRILPGMSGVAYFRK